MLEIARALRFQSALPCKYWGECLLTKIHIVNKLSSSLLNHKTPHELLYHTKPDYTNLRAFGCLAYASVHSTNKFDSRAITCVFLGYPHLQMGFKLLRLDTHAIFVSRHVRFVETVFPYHQISSTIQKSTTVTNGGNSIQFLHWLNNNSQNLNISSHTPSEESSPSINTSTPIVHDPIVDQPDPVSSLVYLSQTLNPLLY